MIRRVKFEQHADGLIFWKRMERDETEEPMNFTVNQGEPESDFHAPSVDGMAPGGEFLKRSFPLLLQ